jgi:hypothetical protein
MSKQPEALILADWCDANSSGIYRKSSEAAAELRRLHAVNGELLAACKSALYLLKGREHDQFLRAAITKAEAAA